MIRFSLSLSLSLSLSAGLHWAVKHGLNGVMNRLILRVMHADRVLRTLGSEQSTQSAELLWRQYAWAIKACRPQEHSPLRDPKRFAGKMVRPTGRLSLKCVQLVLPVILFFPYFV